MKTKGGESLLSHAKVWFQSFFLLFPLLFAFLFIRGEKFGDGTPCGGLLKESTHDDDDDDDRPNCFSCEIVKTCILVERLQVFKKGFLEKFRTAFTARLACGIASYQRSHFGMF
jgi:hypothetical protein